MLKYFLFALVIGLASEALAIPVAVGRRDIKFPSQKMVEHQSWVNLPASNATAVLSGNAGPTSAAAKTVSTGFTNPTYARNLEVSPGGTTADIENCTVTVTGTDINGSALSENFGFTANQATKVTGLAAFKTVTSAAWSASCESGGFAATWSIGTGTKIGLKRCMGNKAEFVFTLADQVKESTDPTIASNASSVSSNTLIFNTAPDGSKDFDFYFFQNFACF